MTCLNACSGRAVQGLLLNLVLGLFLWAQPALSAPTAIPSLEKTFNAELSRHGVVGGAIAVVHGQGPATEYHFGHARIDGPAIDAETSYNWASITKTMTAVAILQLRDRGRLNLDDPAVLYVPELRQVHDAFGPVDKVTIRQLLNHSAGFRNPTWPWDCDDGKDCSWQPFEPTKWSQVAAMLPMTHVAFAPGSRWSYSNLGYVFLGQIIERLSGDDFEVYLDKNILKPLDMRDSYFDVAPYFLEAHVSDSYLRAGKTLTRQPFNYDTGVTTSNSGLKAPVGDMVKYLRFLIGDPANPRFEQVLKRSSLDEMWRGALHVSEPGQTETAYTASKDGTTPQMGLGFFVNDSPGHRHIYHDGDQAGFSAELLLDPAGHNAAILVVNTTDTGEQAAADGARAQSNTEPDPHSDVRLTLRQTMLGTVFPELAKRH
jgi:CubicO group peptidase (beta-lactamase class C family)